MAELPKSCIVAGATGALGSEIARRLAAQGVDLALAGRDRERLESLGEELEAPTAVFEAGDAESCATTVEVLTSALGGLDGIVVCCGVAGFGGGGQVARDGIAELFAVNTLGPMALIDAAMSAMEDGGSVAAISAMVAEFPTAGLAHYSAAKAALSAYLQATARERRRDGITVLDVRPPHLDTAFAEHALFGDPPSKMPEPVAVTEVADRVVAGLGDGLRELAWKPMETEPVTR